MASIQIHRRRIRSVRNTKQITKAMELVAASKLRRIQEKAVQSRDYAELAFNIMHRVSGIADIRHNPLFAEPDPKAPSLLVVFTSDRGLAGAFNSNVLQQATKIIGQNRQAGRQMKVIVFGRKGTHFMSRLDGVEVIGAYENFEELPDPSYFASLLDTILNGVRDRQFSSVNLIYTKFLSTLNQQVSSLPLFPLELSAEVAEREKSRVYEYEPSPELVLARAARLYLGAQLMQARSESAASEHAMRMLAMSNANRNAGDLIDNLTLELNATRQAVITQEIAEITGGAAAIA